MSSAADRAPVRVVVVDDHPVVRAGIIGLLRNEGGIDVVGQAGDGAEAVVVAARVAPDVVLMDLRMPVLDGVEATRALLSRPDAPRVLVLTTYESDEQILAAIEAGASGYLLKAAPPEEIVAGIRAVAAGSAALSPSVAATLVAQVRSGAARPRDLATATPTPPVAPSAQVLPTPDPGLLTRREHEVLTLVAQGLSNPAIGRALFIGEATVKSHLLRVFAKLEVTDRTRAVTRALELGLLRTSPDQGPGAGA